ncbi:MAG: AAA family ATPase [Lachnospiraceae bacterium]|nr:AAA family ATPase [Lachnospiraceae bacterium]
MIEKFFVKKLFGIFDNEINFRDGGITIIVGQNGCGKTTMLHILNAVFSKNHGQLFQYQFDYIELTISGHVLKIEVIDEYIEDEEVPIKSLKYYVDSRALKNYYRENSKMNSPAFWTRVIPSLKRRSRNSFYDMRGGEVLTLSEVIDTYFDELPEGIKNDIVVIPNEVQDLVRDLQIELLTTERLKKNYRDDEYRRMEFVQKFAVEECSEELRNNVKNILSEYANTSQKLDEQFPSKILKAIKQHEQFSGVELKDNIQRIDVLRTKHVKAGVLEENNDKFLNINVNPESLDESTAAILTVYYQDMKIKLDSLNSISDRIVLFKNMMDNKFGRNKEICISKDNGIIVLQKTTNKNVELRFLSSGEQQELVLLYNLIFKGEKEKIILIDEPEISLNVSWQREFLDDMKKIVEINEISILIATHSPQIINDNWDLVETLGELE